jgi:hypothetical protein
MDKNLSEKQPIPLYCIRPLINWLVVDPKYYRLLSYTFPRGGRSKDTGYVDASFREDPANYLNWRINVKSKKSFTDVISFLIPGKGCAHPDYGGLAQVAKVLAPEGETGLSFMELAEKLDISRKTEVLATGPAGTVYLPSFCSTCCQAHRGKILVYGTTCPIG